MVSTLPWPPTHGPRPGAGNVIVNAPATFFRQQNNSLRLCRNPWTLGSAKKTLGVIARTSDVARSSISPCCEYRHVIKLLDIRSGASHGETARDGESEPGHMGELFWTSYPQWLERHGSPLSLDMDDTRGRMHTGRYRVCIMSKKHSTTNIVLSSSHTRNGQQGSEIYSLWLQIPIQRLLLFNLLC